MTPRFRIGLGTDRHRLAPGDALRIGGVAVPAAVRAVGHSDADVVLHALSDALLGAVAEGDIGEHFPDTDPAHAGLDSRRIVEEARRRVARHGYAVGNVDVVVELERPKLAPHRRAIRASIAALLELPLERVGLQAKTGEGLGEVGEGRIIAATAVVLLVPAEEIG
jgi:2-C-methyl-D-erythritol 2,4-cyclodiphosphate synthase